MTGWEEWEGGGAGVKETEEGIWLEGKSRARLPLEPFSGTPSIPLVERLSISSNSGADGLSTDIRVGGGRIISRTGPSLREAAL